jgi:quercetin dioxygenase-like cupin family protein
MRITNQQSNERSTDENALRQFHPGVPEAEPIKLRSHINATKFLASRASSRLKVFVEINRTFLALAVCAAIGVGGTTLAQHTGNSHVKATKLSQRDIIEKLNGTAASVTTEEVIFEPGQEDLAHRHTGAVFGYVLEGEYEHALDDEPVKTYKAGDTFYEPSGSLHRVARNPSDKTTTRLLAVVVHSREDKATQIPVTARQDKEKK